MTNKTFEYQEPFPLSEDKTDYYLLSREHVSTATFEGREMLKVEPEALTLIAQQAVHDASYFLRPAHQKQVAQILSDPEASENDKYVALQLLRNAEISAKGFCRTVRIPAPRLSWRKKASRYGPASTMRNAYPVVFTTHSSVKTCVIHRTQRWICTRK